MHNRDAYTILVNLAETVKNAANSMDSVDAFESFSDKEKIDCKNNTIKEIIQYIKDEIIELQQEIQQQEVQT